MTMLLENHNMIGLNLMMKHDSVKYLVRNDQSPIAKTALVQCLWISNSKSGYSGCFFTHDLGFQPTGRS
jgi:hypothetical protein